MRSSTVSMWPNIIVALVRRPCSCAQRITPSHWSVPHFFGAMRLRMRSTRISAPPPGMLPRPASLNRRMTSASGS